MGKQYDAAMHTVEHVLNQTMVRMFDCGRCFSAHINPGKSKCDYRFDRPLSREEEAELERRVNEVLHAALPIREEWLSRSAAMQDFDLTRLPDGENEEIRIVHVGDYDACPCIGPHIGNTREAGSIVVISSEHKEDVLRIRFKLKKE